MRMAWIAPAALCLLAACGPMDAGRLRGEPAIAAAPAGEGPGAAAASRRAGFSIKLEIPGGQGSGVHIGEGYVLTAAHVALPGRSPTAKLDNGARIGTTVIWRNASYDIALLRMDEASGVEAAHLACTTPRVGAPITTYGSRPRSDFVAAAGTVVTRPRSIDRWPSVMVVEADVVKGMSGGGVLQGGRLVGVAVGVSETLWSSGRITPSGQAYVVPASTICTLAGRT